MTAREHGGWVVALAIAAGVLVIFLPWLAGLL